VTGLLLDGKVNRQVWEGSGVNFCLENGCK
jgi:hypothetical protein